ncbi:MFS transporter [Parasphingopyxis marina]|uniref:MFS transporter n=1 Tax=Parasphingopyxis marina TaxID=2761622 RepID=A0A842HXI0_9SPHN|nr:MFS transporter [Parasphingopyxis marina]MBC2777041.1 MFS transporter [Parasphingopyxis marina]
MAIAPTSGARALAADAPLSGYQLMVVGLCILINICDGLDAIVTSFAAPVLVQDWNLPAEALGLIHGAGATGLMIGALLVSPQADRIGRRPLIILGTFVSTLAMFGMSFSNSVEMLVIFRCLSGIAVGSLLPSLSVMVIEYSNEARGNLFLALVHIGFAAGAALAGLLGATMLDEYGWRGIFFAAGCITALVSLAAAILLPESLYFLTSRQPRNALPKANKLLARLKVAPLEKLPPKTTAHRRSPIAIAALLAKPLLFATLFLWMAAFLRYFVSYFLTSWKPQMLVLAGFDAETAATVGISTSLASALGVLAMGILATRFGAPRTACVTFLMAAVAMVGFGVFDSPEALVAFALLAMFSIEATFTGVMITAARLYPESIRATGVGFAVGIGRFGAILGPSIGGIVIGMGLERSSYMLIYAGAATLGAAAIAIVGILAARIYAEGKAPSATETA